MIFGTETEIEGRFGPKTVEKKRWNRYFFCCFCRIQLVIKWF